MTMKFNKLASAILGLAVLFGVAGAMTAGGGIINPTPAEAGIISGIKSVAKDVAGTIKNKADKGLSAAGEAARKGLKKAKRATKAVGGNLKDAGKTFGKNVARNARIVGRNAKDFGTSAAAGMKDIGKGIVKTAEKLHLGYRFEPRGADPLPPKPPARRVRARPGVPAAGIAPAQRVRARPGMSRKMTPSRRRFSTSVRGRGRNLSRNFAPSFKRSQMRMRMHGGRNRR